MKPVVRLAPSILSADFARLGEQVVEAERAGADYIHVDVMDGDFVPNITIGPAVVSAIKKCTGLPLDVHLMIQKPERHIPEFIRAGASIVTVHVEACTHLHRTVQMIHEMKARAGVALNPATALVATEEILPFVDLALVMTVNPGFGGQPFIEGMLPKITRLREELDRRRLSAELEVDGGLNADNACRVVQAGGRVIVAGTAVFQDKAGIAVAVKRLKESM